MPVSVTGLNTYKNYESPCNSSISDFARGTKIVHLPKDMVHDAGQDDMLDYHNITATSFADFVAIKANASLQSSITYKAAKSYLTAVSGLGFINIEESLKIWIATMTEKQLTEASRRRYFTKLSALYDEYRGTDVSETSPFVSVKQLCSLPLSPDATKIYELTNNISKSFALLLDEASSRPSLTIFLFLLFNASANMEEAIGLTTDQYAASFPQFDNIIVPAEFHHRRVYLFRLQQNRKRMKQLIDETCKSIDNYLRSRKLKVNAGFSPSIIPAIWVAKARAMGISLGDIRAVIDIVPQEFPWLDIVTPSNLNATEVQSIRQRIADAFCPITYQWYAMKLKRNMSFQLLQKTLSDNLPPSTMQQISFFYPIKETVKYKGKKIIKEQAPLLTDIVFIYATPSQISNIDSIARKNGNGWIFRMINSPDSEYSIIDRNSMMLFQRAVGQFSSDMSIDMTTHRPVAIGHRVRITGGDLAGYEGTIYNIRKGENSHRRMIYITLSNSHYVRMQVEVEELFIEPIQ